MKVPSIMFYHGVKTFYLCCQAIESESFIENLTATHYVFVRL